MTLPGKKGIAILSGILLLISIVTSLVARELGLATHNPGVSFGIVLPEAIQYIAGLAALVVAYLLLRSDKWKHAGKPIVLQAMPSFSFSLVIAGVLSNIFDRMSTGGVWDYILLPGVLKFNLADVYLTVGFGIILWLNLAQNRS